MFKKVFIGAILVMLLPMATKASNFAFVFTSMGFSDLSNVVDQSGKAAKTAYIGAGKAVGENTYLFATGGYSQHGMPTGKASTGEILGGLAWLPVGIPRSNPLVRLGIVGEFGAGLSSIDPENAVETAIAAAGGVMLTYAFKYDKYDPTRPVGWMELHARLIDAGNYDKVEIGVGVIWALAPAK